MPLMSSSVLIQNLSTLEAYDLGCDSVVTVIDLDINNISVLPHHHLENSGEIRMLPLYNSHSLDNTDSFHSSSDRQDQLNNREQDYCVIPVASLDTLLGTASRDLIRLRPCIEKSWNNSESCRIS